MKSDQVPINKKKNRYYNNHSSDLKYPRMKDAAPEVYLSGRGDGIDNNSEMRYDTVRKICVFQVSSMKCERSDRKRRT